MLVVALIAAAFLLLGALEYARHRRNLRAIPVRVHVGGTRGKSTVARLVAAGLRAGGLRVVAKTTGAAARYIRADGTEEPIERDGPPHIREQVGVIARAARDGARALVVECMAVRPDLVRLGEERIVQSTVAVLTNVRPDHLEATGRGAGDVARSLAGMVPSRGVLFTAGREGLGAVRARARRLGTEVREVAPLRGDPRARGFRRFEHAENVELAADVCEYLGVPRDVAMRGMREAPPDPGALSVDRVIRGGVDIEFVNAFSANDPASAEAIWEALGLNGRSASVVIVAAMREDRPERAAAFGRAFAGGLAADRYVLAGGGTAATRRSALAAGVPTDRLLDLGGLAADEVVRRLLEPMADGDVVVGIGNTGGVGREIGEILGKERREL